MDWNLEHHKFWVSHCFFFLIAFNQSILLCVLQLQIFSNVVHLILNSSILYPHLINVHSFVNNNV
jgi:hypothetical protein